MKSNLYVCFKTHIERYHDWWDGRQKVNIRAKVGDVVFVFPGGKEPDPVYWKPLKLTGTNVVIAEVVE